MSDLKARICALDLLKQVLVQKQPLDQVMDRHDDFRALEARDRTFARMLVSTVLRYKGVMDVLLNRLQDEPRDIRPEALKLILYLGVAQILYMNVADHAAIDTSNRLAEAENMPKKKAFVNALLRRLQREQQDLIGKIDTVQAAVPEWLLGTWVQDYGLKVAADMTQALLAEAPLDITVKSVDEINYWAGEFGASTLSTGSLRLLENPGVQSMSGFDDGSWWVQDASAALPVKLIPETKEKRIVDLCAAPGGKTAQLAASGARVIALDRSAKRLERLTQNMQRLGFEEAIDVVVSDGAVWQPEELVDVVLLDAPCSATGTIRRHPEVMHLKSLQDVEQLMSLQMRLLDNSAKMLKQGGVLIYCTCSLQKDEGERQIDLFLENNKDFVRDPVSPKEIGGLSDAITPQGDVRILPYFMAAQGGMDGFFISRLKKQA